MSGAENREEQPFGTEAGDPRRATAAFLIAVAIHAGLFVFPFLSLREARLADTGPLVVDLEASAIQTGEPAESPRAVEVKTEQVLAQPAANPQADAFVIPSPKPSVTQPEENVVAGGQSFRESGARTGTTAQTAAPPGPQPAIAAADTSASGAASAVPAGAGSDQPPAKGRGVLVTGQTQPASGGSLDLGSLDRALAGTRSSEGSTPQGSQAGQEGKAGELQIQWEEPQAALGRKLVSSPGPKIPAWVGAQGLTLTVVLSFTVSPEGVVSSPTVTKSSGYVDVDAAVVEAVRLWRFTADRTARPIKGVVPYVIRAR